jgi:hypothetical protein
VYAYDASGQEHLFIEKIPVVTTEDLWSSSAYPKAGWIACEVVAEWVDVNGRALSRITTASPWDIESTLGTTEFIVPSSHLSDS